MKDAWRKVRLGDVCNSISVTHKLEQDRVVLINTSDVYDGKVENHEYVKNKNIRGQFKKTFHENDILFSEIRPKNKRFAFVDFKADDYVASTKLMVIRNNDKVLPKFLFQILKNEELLDYLQLQAETRSGTFPQITFSELQDVEIPLPPLPVQRAIAATLSCLDDKIELNSRVNANLEAQAQAIFKSWFVDFEPFKGGGFVDSELGRIPKGWKILSFSEFLSLRNERSDNQDIPEYSVTNNGIFPREKTFKKKLSFAGAKNKIIYKTDLVFGMSREILNWGIMKEPIGGVSSAYHIFTVTKNIPSSFLESFIKFNSSYFKDLIKPASREGQGIDKTALFSKFIYLPPDEILDEYYAIEGSLRELIGVNETQSRALAAIRDALLPRLLSGEIEVVDT